MAAGAGNSGVQQGEGRAGNGRGGREDGSWRQRVVRTFVTVLMRIRAAVVAVFRLRGRPKTPSNTSLFRATGRCRGRSDTAGGANGSKGTKGKGGILRRINRKTAVLVASLMLFAAMNSYAGKTIPKASEVPMSKFLEVVEGKRTKNLVENLRVARTGRITYLLDGKQSYTQPVMVQKFVQEALSKNGVPYTAAKAPAVASGAVTSLLPVLYLLGVYFFIVKKGAGDMIGSTGKLASSSDLDRSLTFSDVAGVDEAKSQVQELVTMIKNPGPFLAAGARLPSGLLMVGPPGTGKTLMARVMASEAGVPFYYCSGSDFVEMFVGRGAARVRKLFDKAAKSAPCIVFLDELDALGKERSSGGSGGRQSNDEAEQTLNQLLASMDGLDTNNNGVMVIAATNRFDVLDNALTRPGRFDRVVKVDVPSTTGREAILKVHTRRMKLADASILAAVSEITPGLTGAELATIANEAAISAARRGSQTLTGSDFQASVQNFFLSRKKGAGALQNMIKGMLS